LTETAIQWLEQKTTSIRCNSRGWGDGMRGRKKPPKQ